MSAAVRDLFHELAGRSRTQREDHYARQRVPANVRAELESLFLFDESGGESIANAVGSAAGQLLRFETPFREGSMCGPYRLVRQIGEGGMGTVFLAERADGEVEQQAAIKFIRPGYDIPALMRRFLRERQILATLNHSGIARLLDVGRLDGTPYLVMEFVEGTRIDQYAEGRGERALAALVRQVADAVAHAHRNLVIHRDLKPSNILVDADGTPKLLDFGIAKNVETSDETHTMDRLMTPDYASPEQVSGGAQTTATDIYSLGGVLYNLLTGRPPRQPLDLTEMSADMAAIIQKAMREEPAERYQTADLFVADLDAFLADRPVAARRGKVFYAVRKFVRRHRLAAGASALAIGCLAAGLYAAAREREIAQRRFEQVKEASRQFQEMEGRLRRVPGATKERGDLVVSALQNLERLGAGSLDNEMAIEISNAYLQVARVQGVPVTPNLGKLADAERSLEKADSLIADPRFEKIRASNFLAAEIAHDRMILADTVKRDQGALAFAKKVIRRAEAGIANQPLTPTENARIVRIYSNVALTFSNLHLMDEAAFYSKRAVELARGPGEDPYQLSKALGVAASAARSAGQLDSALRFIREAHELTDRNPDMNNADFVFQLVATLWREGILAKNI
ncbi:MAG: serine/threonine protein kinase [Acidobacteria bacterium]|nr:serine/threonine protein kinase [Acidobacteriota bacterium]